jgi:hypothetical protein
MIGEWNNGTGRRKSSVARVFLKKGSGHITVNGKDIQAYFGRETSIMIAKQPLLLTNHAETFDIQVNVHGGGESGQAGSSRAMPAKWNGKKWVCVRLAVASSSASAKRPETQQKPPSSQTWGGFCFLGPGFFCLHLKGLNAFSPVA